MNLNTTKILPTLLFSLSFHLFACSSSSPSSPAQGGSSQGGTSQNQGGTSQSQGGTSQSDGGAAGSAGGVAGSAGQNLAGAPGGNAGTSGGEGGQGPDLAKLCADSCGLLKDCPNADTLGCEAQCLKEVTGTGYLIPEIALDFFKTLGEPPQNIEPQYKEIHRCYWDKNYWIKWSPASAPKGKYTNLKDQEVLNECADKRFQCDGEASKADHQAYCLGEYYRYNTDRREKIKPCYALACLDVGICVKSHQLGENLYFPTKPEPE